MSEFTLMLALDRAVEVANETVQEGGYLTGEEILAMFIEAGQKVDYEKKQAVSVKQIGIGNEHTGDLTALMILCDSLVPADTGNWVEGTQGGFKFQAKIFNEQSGYGIKNGRISKLAIHDINQLHWGFEGCYVNYDRSWDVYPTTDEAVAFLNSMLEALGDDVMTDEDLIYYHVYLYDTPEDFDNMNSSDNFGAFSSMDYAREAAEDYPEYERIKIVSSDGEEIEIIENEPVEPVEDDE